ncbi:MAG: hypothetical protein QG560_112 [Campylobacterota bacterium]|nr:hypothetical protein [Campylobacterota bacterium]
MENIEALLKKVGDIVKRYEDEDQKTGRRFNVYSIAGIERDEVKTHSAMIAELLNPKGSHGQDNLFLKLFLERFFEKSEIENTNKAQVYVETSYGNNGRVDIEIILNDHYIIIENKVDAGDQPEQLKRYSDIAENVKKYAKDKYSLLYLTKYGREPSEESLKSNTSNDSIKKVPNGTSEDLVTWKKGDECIDLRLISYREDIRNWLEECIKQSVFIPNIRDGLTQYLNLVKKIIGLEMTSVKEHIIEELYKSQDKLLSALHIASAFNSAELRGKILFNFFENIQDELAKKNYEKIDREKISPDNQKYLYKDSDNTEKPCIEWFERKTEKSEKGKKSWEGKGFFMKISNNPNFCLHIEVATDALHYGLVQVDVIDGTLVFAKNNNEIADKIKSDIFTRRDWKEWEFYWFSNIYTNATNIHIFNDKVIKLLTDKNEIENFIAEIDEKINNALGE